MEEELCHCNAVLLSWSFCHFYLTTLAIESVACCVDATDEVAQEGHEEGEVEEEVQLATAEIVVEDTR